MKRPTKYMDCQVHATTTAAFKKFITHHKTGSEQNIIRSIWFDKHRAQLRLCTSYIQAVGRWHLDPHSQLRGSEEFTHCQSISPIQHQSMYLASLSLCSWSYLAFLHSTARCILCSKCTLQSYYRIHLVHKGKLQGKIKPVQVCWQHTGVRMLSSQHVHHS